MERQGDGGERLSTTSLLPHLPPLATPAASGAGAVASGGRQAELPRTPFFVILSAAKDLNAEVPGCRGRR